MRALILLLPLLLTQCVDPYGNPMNPFGPQIPPPYTEQREQYRQQTQDYSRQQNQAAYERGISDAQLDSSDGLSKSYSRHSQSYSTATHNAYQAGYDQGYRRPPAAFSESPSSSWQDQPHSQTPSYQAGNSGTPPPVSDPAYNQGYDFGLRDRVARRQNDPSAHTGVYDPRFRRSFERGYSDAYNSRR